MSLSKKFIDLGRKPSGLLDRFIGSLMNLGHKEVYGLGLAYLSIIEQ